MTNDEIRIAMAQACGWTKVGEYTGLRSLYGHKPGLPFGCLSRVPNFPLDLNACHEFEKTLTEAGWDDYLEHLRRITYREEMPGYTARRHCHAEAVYKCEAFLRVKGLWKEKTL